MYDNCVIKDKKKGLQTILDDSFKFRNINKKYLKEYILKELNIDLETTLAYLDKAIKNYKRLYHMTELYENKTPLEYDFKIWNTLKKVNGRITRYYNELMEVRRYINEQIRKDNSNN